MVRTRRESLDRRDLLALHLLEGNLTGAYRRPVEMDRAGAARTRAATEFCAGELEVLSHHPQQRRVGLSLDAHCLAIDPESASGHALPPSSFVPMAIVGRRRPIAALRGVAEQVSLG